MYRLRCLLALGASLIALAALPALCAAGVPWSRPVLPLFANPFIEQFASDGLQPQAEDPPAPSQAVVRWYGALFQLSRTSAQSHLEVEARGLHMKTLVAAALGSHFGGVWFDNRLGKYYVGLPAGADWEVAEDAVAAIGMTEGTVFAPVQFSVAELEAANASVTQEMLALERVNEVAVGTNEAGNEVQIIIPTYAKSLVREVAPRVAAAAGAKTVLVERTPRSGRKHPLDCSTSYDRINDYDDTYCDKPLRSAAGMDDDVSGTECSVGGVALGGASTYVVTAGHCLAGELGHHWSTVDTATGKRQTIGTAIKAVNGIHGDFGLIREGDGDSYWLAPDDRYADVNGETPAYGIEGVLESFDGMYQCWAGAQSNVHHHLGCGTVVATNVSEDSTFHLDEAFGPPNPGGHPLCLYDGDSGGPVLTFHYLDGLTSAGSGCNEHEYAATYTAAPRIERYYGVEFVGGLF